MIQFLSKGQSIRYEFLYIIISKSCRFQLILKGLVILERKRPPKNVSDINIHNRECTLLYDEKF